MTVGSNNNGKAQPSNFSTDYAPGKVATNEGATAMAFYNVQQGDAPYFKSLADNYAMGDTYHQAAMGGTGANHIMLGFGDAIWFSDENGNPLVPPHNQMTWAGGPVDEIENPNPQPGTNNFWVEDGYGGFGRLWYFRWSLRRRQLRQLLRYVAAGGQSDRELFGVTESSHQPEL